jgi:hypothetical protein
MKYNARIAVRKLVMLARTVFMANTSLAFFFNNSLALSG